MGLVFVDCEARGPSPVSGILTEFGAVHYVSRATFHGRLFEARPLRELLLDAIRYGERPEVKARLYESVDSAVDREHLEDLLEDRALVRETMDPARVEEIREQMERA